MPLDSGEHLATAFRTGFDRRLECRAFLGLAKQLATAFRTGFDRRVGLEVAAQDVAGSRDGIPNGFRSQACGHSAARYSASHLQRQSQRVSIAGDVVTHGHAFSAGLQRHPQRVSIAGGNPNGFRSQENLLGPGKTPNQEFSLLPQAAAPPIGVSWGVFRPGTDLPIGRDLTSLVWRSHWGLAWPSCTLRVFEADTSR